MSKYHYSDYPDSRVNSYRAKNPTSEQNTTLPRIIHNIKKKEDQIRYLLNQLNDDKNARESVNLYQIPIQRGRTNRGDDDQALKRLRDLYKRKRNVPSRPVPYE